MSYSGSSDRLFLGLEQLEVCRELLLADSPAKARMAVILLDGLADALLYRHIQDLYRASEEPFLRHEMPRYGKKLRQELRMQFDRRVELAQEVTYYDTFWRDGSPLVDDLDATILKVGHSYRNDAYHHDHHNPAVIGLVGRVLMQAVARVFVRAQPRLFGIGHPEPRMPALERLGVEVEPLSQTYGDAAARATETLLAGLDVAPDELADALADDLEARAGEAEEMAGYLPQSGADLDAALARYEVWSKHAADEDVLELSDRADPVRRAMREGLESVPDEYIADAQDATRALFARMGELERASKPTVTLALIAEAHSVAEKLRGKRNLATIMSTYFAVDRKLSVLEDYLGEAVSAYDREVQLRIDIARGK